MANTLTAAIPKIISRTLDVLRENAVFPRLINTGYSVDPKGDTVTIPVSAAQTAAAITPSNTPPANSDHAMTSKTITVDTWNGTRFHLTDDEVTQINENDHWRVPQLDEAVKALANDVDQAVAGLFTDVYLHTGTGGTTPFASSAQFATDFTKGARKLLQDSLAPLSDRHCVLDPAAEGNILALDQFSNMEVSGRDEGIIEGEMGRRFGTSWWMNQNIQSHTGNSPSGWLVNDASSTAGDTTLTIDTGSGDPAAGDAFSVADTNGVTRYHTVASYAANVITLDRATEANIDDNAAITFLADHVANLYFHRDAFALVTKMPEDMSGLGTIIPVLDPITGLVFRLEVRRDYKQTTLELDYRYGVSTVRPEFACRIAG